MKPPIWIIVLHKVATTSCESLTSERCLWNKLNEIVYYGHRRHRNSVRRMGRVDIKIAFTQDG